MRSSGSKVPFPRAGVGVPGSKLTALLVRMRFGSDWFGLYSAPMTSAKK